MKRLALLLTLFVASCAPAFEPAEGRATFTAEGGRLVVGAETSIAYGTFAVRGEVESAYKTGEVNGQTIIDLPQGNWGPRKQVGTYTGPVSGFGTVVLVGGSEGLDVDLVQR